MRDYTYFSNFISGGERGGGDFNTPTPR